MQIMNTKVDHLFSARQKICPVCGKSFIVVPSCKDYLYKSKCLYMCSYKCYEKYKSNKRNFEVPHDDRN